MTRPWDDGVHWHLEQLVPPDLAADTLPLAFVRDDHLKLSNGGAEDTYVAWLIATSLRAAERVTRRSILPQTWELVLDRFPACDILLPRPPLQSVTSITYIDPDGVEQTLVPPAFQVSAPSGPTAGKGRIRPLADEQWPETQDVLDAVRVEYVAGYPLVGSPLGADVPTEIDQGRLLFIAELYRSRGEPEEGPLSPAVLRARDLWLPYRVT